jgi:hypothetical protein
MPKARPRQLAVYRERKAKGICVRCGKRRAKKGVVRCGACKRYTADWVNARYHKLALRGLCVKCGVNPVRRFRQCSGCRLGEFEKNAKRRAA